MKKPPRFSTSQADFLAKAASEQRLVTYGEFAKQFGYANQGCGQVLSDMGRRLRQFSLPMLPVLVVNKDTGLPSEDTQFYEALGLATVPDIQNEQERCFSFDWRTQPFWSD